MPIVQPGQVPTYEPSPAVSLSGYDDSDRTRLLFNGSQFVKARLALSRPSFGYVGYFNSALGDVISHKNYKTLAGKYALVDGDRGAPVATGVPTYGDFILVGFSVQVSTSEVVLWSTAHLDYYDLLKVKYTYDNPDVVTTPFYFDATVSSVVETFDFDENKYKYTITLDGSYTAKYYKVYLGASTTLSSGYTEGGGTLSVLSTSGFPEVILSGDDMESSDGDGFVYTGKTGSTFTGVSGLEDLAISSTVLFRPGFAEYITEVEIGSSYEPLLEFWNTSGTYMTPQVLSDDFYYDIVYDKSTELYYVIRFNEELNGTGGGSFSPDDNFNDSGSGFDSVRWYESTLEPNFQHNTSSGTLDYVNSSVPGCLTTKYYLDGDFNAQIDVGFNTLYASTASVAIKAIDYEANNVFVQMGFHGPWIWDGDKTGKWEAVSARVTTDTSGGTASIHNLRLNSKYLVDGVELYTFTYNASSGKWGITDTNLTVYTDLVPGEDYEESALALSIVHDGSPSGGAQFVLDVNTQHYALPVDTAWDWKIALEKVGDSYICKYDEGSGFINYVTFTDTNDYGANIELFADGDGGAVDVALDNFDVTGVPGFPGINVFSIEAVDGIGNPTAYAGVTDDEGYLIKRFDVINTDLDYNSYIGNRVQLATDGVDGGSLFIKVGTDLYEYSKATLPLDLEDGSLADNFKEDVVPETTAVALSYNSYSNAGLCYLEYDDDRSGVYLKTLDVATLSGTDYEAYLDVSSTSYPFAWHINNYTVLYYVDSTNLKEYDLDENDVAFCNLVADDKIMSAGSSETTDVTATVLNVYGEPLSSKSVTFAVSSGAGALSPSSACTTASGVASTVYTVGNTVGNTTITASASDASC